MVEHNLPQTADSARPPVIPLPVWKRLVPAKESEPEALRIAQRACAPPSVNTNLAVYVTAFLGASAVVRFAAPSPGSSAVLDSLPPRRSM